MTPPSIEPRRGLGAPLIATAIAFIILVSLGLWQLQRKELKENLIATLDQRLAAAPVELPPAPNWSMLSQGDDEFRRVKARVEFADSLDVYVYAAGSALRPDLKGQGYFVFTPARLSSGETIVVNRGFVPAAPGTPVSRLDVPGGGAASIIGYLRWPESSNWFVADRSPAEPIWFIRDPRAMAREHGWGEVAPFYIDLEQRSPAVGVPLPGPLTPRLRNDHLGYALTWLGLAVALVAVFLFYAIPKRSRKV